MASFWNRLHLSWRTLIVVATLGILAIPFFGTAKKAQREWSDENDLAAAQTALAAGRHVEARDLSLAILRRNPQKNDALPIFMHSAEGAADSRLVAVARGYLSLNTQVKAERMFAWKAVSKQSPMGIAASTWLAIREDEKADPDFLVPWLERLLIEQLTQRAEVILAAPANLTDPRLERIRLSMLVRRGTNEAFHELQVRLMDRIATHPVDAPLLLGALDDVPQAQLGPSLFTALARWVKICGAEPSVEDQMRIARCEIAASPETKETVLTRTLNAHAVTAPLAVARLCSTLDRLETSEKLLEPLLTKGDSAVFKLMAEVLEHSGKLEKWDKLLERPPVDAFLPEILCDRAFIASKRGDERAQPKFEQEAVAAAELHLCLGDLGESDSPRSSQPLAVVLFHQSDHQGDRAQSKGNRADGRANRLSHLGT